MSSHYSPDPAALPIGIPFTRLLSERDVALQIPLNYVTTPGIALAPACFAHKRYEDAPATKCFSNLLAVGFARFEVDIYWDVTRRVWSLCPVELGPSISTSSSSTISTSLTSTSITQASKRNDAVPAWSQHGDVEGRQNVPITTPLTRSSTRTEDRTSVRTPSALQTAGAVATMSDTSSALGDATLSHIGPFSCTSSMNLDLLADVLSGHLRSTQNNLNATVKYLFLNLHVAASASDPTGTAAIPSTSDLPKGDRLLSSILFPQVSTYLYTPSDLQGQRSDLNASKSWFGDPQEIEPDASYFTLDTSAGVLSTPDGWPSESFVEMGYAKRLLAAFGQVQSQMAGYNFTADAATIFEGDYIRRAHTTKFTSAGQIENGCFYRAGSYSIGSANNSWATSTESISLLPAGTNPWRSALTAALSLTMCGISPTLNETLEGVTADQDFRPYSAYVQNMIWSWASSEPVSATDIDNDNSDIDRRCAVLNATSGQWQTEDCGQAHYSACRRPSQTYEWNISNSATRYINAELPCPEGTEFFVPRTALENTYLTHTWRQTVAEHKIDDLLLWLNFNDLDAAACWVIGQNTTCPYLAAKSDDVEILVPIVGAVIVFVVAALTVFVKCAANRQQSKRRKRRGDDGWDYEGVPS